MKAEIQSPHLKAAWALGRAMHKHFIVRVRGPQGDNDTYCMMKVGYTLANKGPEY